VQVVAFGLLVVAAVSVFAVLGVLLCPGRQSWLFFVGVVKDVELRRRKELLSYIYTVQ
jgi:hypothetical protein